MSSVSGREWRQFVLLSRDSVRRLIASATFARDADPMQFALWAVALAAVPPAFYAFSQMFTYIVLRQAPPDVVERVVVSHRVFFIVYAMLASALLAAFTWDALFPDKQDQEIVGVLPVLPRTLAAARLTGAITVAAAYALAIGVPGGVVFAFISTAHPRVGFLPTVFVAHVAATFSACLFTFFGLLILRGVVTFCGGTRVAQRFAAGLQFLTVVGIVEVFFFLPGVLPALVTRLLAGDPGASALPPVWFAALDSLIVGSHQGVLASNARTAVGAFAATVALVVGVYLVPARIVGRRALEESLTDRGSWLGHLPKLASAVLAPGVRARAVAAFAITSLLRNRRHAFIVTSYLGMAIATGIVGLLAARLRGTFSIAEPTPALLALPLVMMFFMVLGLRSAFTVPADLDANWIFRLSPPGVPIAARATAGVMGGMVIVPVAFLVGVAGMIGGWNVSTIAAVIAFSVSSGWLLVACATYGCTKLPFTCAHVPATETMKSRWPMLSVGLYLYAFKLADLQFVALPSVRRTAIVVATLAIAGGTVSFLGRRTARRSTLQFNVEPEGSAATLSLSEALH